MARAIEPTDQQLREACARMAQRFRWAEDFDAAMRDPTRSRLVRMAAMHPSAAGTPPQQLGAAPARRAPRLPRAALPLFDRKRAAAGEREDD